MTRQKLLSTVADHLADLLEQENLELTETSTADDFKKWDSINHVRLLISLERELGIEFGTDEIGVLDNVGALLDLIEAKQAQA